MYRISSSGGCQRLRALLLLLLPKIGAFRGPSAHVPPMSATNLFPTDSDGVESPVDEALASESRSLDFRDHHRFYIIRHGETDANAADGKCFGLILTLRNFLYRCFQFRFTLFEQFDSIKF